MAVEGVERVGDDRGMTSEGAPRALVLRGDGRYADEWHDLAETSRVYAELLADLGVHAQVRVTAPDAAEDLDAFDLLVVNASGVVPDVDGVREPEADDLEWVGFHARIAAWADAGGPLLGVHQAAFAFPDAPQWPRLIGGRWAPGRSMHPDRGRATLRTTGDHALVAGLATVTVDDERYAFLDVHPGSTAYLAHEHVGADHPVAWAVDDGRCRAVYDALGHDAVALSSPDRHDLLRREITWLLRRDTAPA